MPEIVAKPFTHWVGGKRQLIPTIIPLLPDEIDTYIEPFVGGGAILFKILNTRVDINNVIINDANADLINVYTVIKEDVERLIGELFMLDEEFYRVIDDPEDKKEYYYNVRSAFNKREESNIRQAAYFIFLNKTCFNGLYRVNKKNEFNSPIGTAKQPIICDESLLRAVNTALANVTILNVDFEETLEYASGKTVFYFDPPYHPLSNTANFSAYTKSSFNDDEQVRLYNYCNTLDKLGHTWLLSNSDSEDKYIRNLYKDYYIRQVWASRAINSDATKRSKIPELLVANYDIEEKEECSNE